MAEVDIEKTYMSMQAGTIGNQIDAELRSSSQTCHISARPLITLHDLLSALCEDKQIAMLRTTAGHIAAFLNSPIDRLNINALVNIVPEFRAHLKNQRYKKNAANSYCNYARMLLRKAKERGWVQENLRITEEWRPIASVVGPHHGCMSIIKFAISRGRTPANFSQEDLTKWEQDMLSRGKNYIYVKAARCAFCRNIVKADLADRIPNISIDWKPAGVRYSVPIGHFPKRLREEIEELLRWRQAPYVQTRRKKRVRPVTALNVEKGFAALYGFLKNISPSLDAYKSLFTASAIHTLPELVTLENVSAFADWSLNVRNHKGVTFLSYMAGVCAALKEHPRYKHISFTWFDDLLKGIPQEPESNRRERKERKYLAYEAVVDIPRQIRAKRKEAVSAKHEARLVHDALLIQWLTVLPWRQRNIRELRVGLKSAAANLFKGEIEQWDSVAKPRWVVEKMRSNPREQFWQYHFREHETKNGREVRSILPRRLVPFLEEYLEHCRPLLFRADPSTLFLNESGKSLTNKTVVNRVSQITLQFAGRRVTPHIFRDIWAYWWLSKHPEDYLTVSKKLWHRNLLNTLRVYGCKFDESQADLRVEEFIEGNS